MLIKGKSPKQAAYLFFLRNAGFSYDPKTETKSKGRARCARQLAKAERDARALGYTFNWDADLDGCIGCGCGRGDCACAMHDPHECLNCSIWDSEGNLKGSLGSICEPSRDYRRVVEAELALEELG